MKITHFKWFNSQCLLAYIHMISIVKRLTYFLKSNDWALSCGREDEGGCDQVSSALDLGYHGSQTVPFNRDIM